MTDCERLTADISIHAAREGGDMQVITACVSELISIHAAREGGDKHPVRNRNRQCISIHAAREGGDI